MTQLGKGLNISVSPISIKAKSLTDYGQQQDTLGSVQLGVGQIIYIQASFSPPNNTSGARTGNPFLSIRETSLVCANSSVVLCGL